MSSNSIHSSNEKSYKVLFVVPSMMNGGRERQLIELLKGLRQQGVPFSLISMSKRNDACGLEEFAEHMVIIDRREGHIKTFFRYLKHVRKFKPQIIHCWDHYTTLLTVLFKPLIRVRLVDGSIRGAQPYFMRKLFLFFTHPFTDYLIANSLAGMHSANRELSRKNKVIYNGLDVARFQTEATHQEIKQKFGIPDGLIVGMVANIRKGKDYSTFVHAAEKVMKQHPGTLFVSIGAGKYEEPDFEQLDEKVKRNIIFLGQRDNVEEIIQVFDIGMLLSDTRYAREGISNSLMELMYCGVPVIATNVGGNVELIENGVTGILVAPFDVDGVASKIIELIDNQKMRLGIGNAGSEQIKTRYSLERMVSDYLQLYQSLLR